MKKGIVILFALLTLLSLAVLVACDNVGKEEVTYTITFMDVYKLNRLMTSGP